MRVGHAAVIGSLLVLLVLVPGIGVGQTDAPEADRTVTTVEIRPDGDAVWTVEVWTRLSDDSSVDRFRSFQDRFEANSSRYVDPFESRIRSVVGSAANATERNMQARNLTGRTRIQEVPRRWGVVVYRFEWTNFARVEAGSLRVGDVFEGGYYLTRSDTLRLEYPSAFDRTAVEPVPETSEDTAVEWTGEQDFASGRPRLVLTDGAGGTTRTNTTTSPGETSTSGGGPGPSGNRSWLLPLGALVALGLVATGGYAFLGRGGSEPNRAVTTDAEAVEALLSDNGGRMKQAEVAEALDWTPSKTSRVLSSMEEDGLVERIRVGRENLVSLSEE